MPGQALVSASGMAASPDKTPADSLVGSGINEASSQGMSLQAFDLSVFYLTLEDERSCTYNFQALRSKSDF
jgi:hypothetical protein